MRRLTRRQRIAAITLAVVALALITLDLGGRGLDSAHTGVRGAMGSLYRGTDSVLGPVRRFVQGLPTAGSNQQRVEKLEHENAVLQGQLAAQARDRRTSTELAALQGAASRGGYRVLPAEVTALGPGEGFDWTATLDVGTTSGVRVDQTVTDGHGLVGRVLHADSSSSVVLLAADPGSGVGVRDTRTGQLALATGAGPSGLLVRPLDPTTAIKVGDTVETGPAGASSFVAGVTVGTVTAVRAGADDSVVATVRPTVSPTALDLVGVILVGGH